jgi:DNA invertase Pin-like site-specific DNA recombinase
MPLRFAIWTAVSTAEQARPEKFSIPDQLERTRGESTRRGWVEACGPFVVSGQSRTKYIQLDQAAAEIEPLRLMLASARNGQFDILVMTEFDRLRELLDQVFRTLAAYRVQLFSLAQPIEPVNPAEYNIYRADSIAMMIGMSQIMSRQEISRTRRKWFDNMPRRITELGLPVQIPFGYRKPPGQQHDRKAIPEQDPATKDIVLKIKDLHLSGLSSYQIAEMLQKARTIAPRGKQWHSVTVRDILKNPFYSGIVQFGKSRVILDPQTDTRKRDRSIPLEQIHQNQGKHIPLWDEATQRAILVEFTRRTKSFRGRMNNQLTGLPKCGICGASLWRQGNGPRGQYRQIWRCSKTGSAHGHINIPHVTLLEKVMLALKDITLQPERGEPSTKPTHTDTSTLQRKLDRLEEAYLAGQFELPRYTKLRAELTGQLQQAEDSAEKQKALETQRLEYRQNMNLLRTVDSLPRWFSDTDPNEVNHVLKSLIEKIVVGMEGIEIVMK